MYKISVEFIKEQSPKLTLNKLIGLYKKELEEQSVSNISISDNTLDFSNNTFKIVLNRYANKFSGFSAGHIKIVDNTTAFVVCIEASIKRLFIAAAIYAGIACLFALISLGLNFIPLVIGILIFCLLSVIGFISLQISFPIYFTRLRNEFESEMQNGEE